MSMQMQMDLMSAQIRSLEEQVKILKLQVTSTSREAASASEAMRAVRSDQRADPRAERPDLRRQQPRFAPSFYGEQQGFYPGPMFMPPPHHMGPMVGPMGPMGPMHFMYEQAQQQGTQQAHGGGGHGGGQQPAAASMEQIMLRAKEFNGYSASAFAAEGPKMASSLPQQTAETPAAPKTMAAVVASKPAVAPVAAEPTAVPAVAAPPPKQQHENAVTYARKNRTRLSYETLKDDLFEIAVEDSNGSLLVAGSILPRWIWPLDRDNMPYEGFV